MATEQRAGRSSSHRYTEVEKAQAVRLVRALRAELGTDHGTVRRVADQLGFGVESVRKWVRQADIDDGVAAGTTSADRGRLREREQENRELRSANAFLRSDAPGRHRRGHVAGAVCAPHDPLLTARRIRRISSGGTHRQQAEPAVGQRLDLRGDVGRRGVCVLHRRRVQPADRRLASSGAHAHRHGARRPGDGPRVPRRAPGRPGGAFRRPVEPGQFTSLRWGERLAELGAVPSVGSVGDSYDCDVMVGLPGRV